MSKKSLPDHAAMTDDQLADFWEGHEPEEFIGWQDSDLRFVRPRKRPFQFHLDPRDLWAIDRESKRTGIARAQLVHSWVREKLATLPSSS